MDISYLFLLIIFLIWLYFLDISIQTRVFGYSILQFIVAIPFIIYLASSSYINGFIFGYAVVLAVAFCSIFTMAYNFYGIQQ